MKFSWTILAAVLCCSSFGIAYGEYTPPSFRPAASVDELNARNQKLITELAAKMVRLEDRIYFLEATGSEKDKEKELKKIARRWDTETWKIRLGPRSFQGGEPNPYIGHDAPHVACLVSGETYRDLNAPMNKARRALAVKVIIDAGEDPANVVRISGRVIQVLSNGLLIERSGVTVFVEVKNTRDYVDGARYAQYTLAAGRYQYTSTLGSVNTIQKFTEVEINNSLSPQQEAVTANELLAFLIKNGIDQIPSYRPATDVVERPEIKRTKKSSNGMSTSRSSYVSKRGIVEFSWAYRPIRVRTMVKDG